MHPLPSGRTSSGLLQEEVRKTPTRAFTASHHLRFRTAPFCAALLPKGGQREARRTTRAIGTPTKNICTNRLAQISTGSSSLTL